MGHKDGTKDACLVVSEEPSSLGQRVPKRGEILGR